MKKPKIVYKSKVIRWNPFLQWVAGITLYSTIHFKRTKEEVSDKLFRHELEHYYQAQRLGFFKFYFKYIWLSIRHGYKKHPMEIEANEVENSPLTDVERKWKNES